MNRKSSIVFSMATFIGLMMNAPLASANSLGAVTAKVNGTGTYDDGAIYIFFDRQISSCNTSGRLDIPAGHPARTQLLSLAMTAFSSDANLRIHPGSCAGGVPVFGTAGDSYMYLTK